MEIIKLYPENFANNGAWEMLCSELDVPDHALWIELKCSKVKYELEDLDEFLTDDN